MSIYPYTNIMSPKLTVVLTSNKYLRNLLHKVTKKCVFFSLMELAEFQYFDLKKYLSKKIK